MRWPAALALLLAFALTAEDAWRLEVTARRELAIGSSVRVTAQHGDQRIDLRLACIAPGRATARAFIAGPSADAFATARAHPGMLVAINGGYFDRERQPLGRLVVDAVEHADSVQRAPLSGLAWSDGGDLRLAAAESTVAATHAIQAGPFLIDPGGTIGIRQRAGPGAARSALAITRDGTLLAIVSTPTTLYAFASVLHALPSVVKLPPVEAALNLDGGPSAALVIAGDDAMEPRGHVVSAWGFGLR